MLSYFSCYCLP